jgi:hypothetical protein
MADAITNGINTPNWRPPTLQKVSLTPRNSPVKNASVSEPHWTPKEK